MSGYFRSDHVQVRPGLFIYARLVLLGTGYIRLVHYISVMTGRYR